MKHLIFLILSAISINALGWNTSSIENIREEAFYDEETDLHFLYYGKDTHKCIVVDGIIYYPFDTWTLYHGEKFEIPSKVINDGEEFEVVGIHPMAFWMCDMKYLSFPPTLRFIGYNCFESCYNLETLIFNEGLETIGYNSFNELDKITEITLPNSLFKIENNCFSRCPNLTKINFGKGLTIIEEGAFCNNEKLLEVEVPEYARSGRLGLSGAFNNNPSLRKVTIGKWAAHDFLESCFNGCPEIEVIICHSADPEGFRNCFDAVDKEKCIVYVPDGAISRYLRAPGWNEFNLREISSMSSTPEIDIDDNDDTTEVYNLQGIKLNSTSNDGSINIIRNKQDGNCIKVLKK